MLITIFILLATLLVLVVMYVLDDALRVMNERAGLPAGNGMRWSKRIVWVVLALVVAQFFVSPGPVRTAAPAAGHLRTRQPVDRCGYHATCSLG